MNRRLKSLIWFIALLSLSILFLAPIFVVVINSLKGQFYINDAPFSLPTKETFVGFENYVNGIQKTGFIGAFTRSLFITVTSVILIVIFSSMAAWYLTRKNDRLCKLIYYSLIFSMIVPFQMVMFTMSKTANTLGLETPAGITVLYLGFGAGLSVFMFSGFVRSIPMELEEAASIDGCGPIRTFFSVVLPILKPTAITVSILNAMWIWNDYLLPYLVIGNDYKTIPIAVQYLQGGYGSRDMGALMAMLVLSIIPIVLFYLISQKQIIKGVIAGAVKG